MNVGNFTVHMLQLQENHFFKTGNLEHAYLDF